MKDTSDGGGVRLRRSVGSPQLDHVDPFLLLDEFKSAEGADYVAGAERPHALAHRRHLTRRPRRARG